MNTLVLKKIVRSVQVHFPFLQDYKYDLQRNFRKVLNQTHEEDFEILSMLWRGNNNLFLDIGANRGEAIQSILMRVPQANIIAFEPNPLLIDKIFKLYKDEPRVKVINTGLGDKRDTFELHVPFYNNYMFDGLASFKEENARDWLRTRLYGFQNENLCIKKVSCNVSRLDDYNLKPFFIKIDVQGFEYEVLLGARKTLAEAKPILLMETPGNKEITFLSRLGYESFVCKNNKLHRGSNNRNVFFIHSLLVAELYTFTTGS